MIIEKIMFSIIAFLFFIYMFVKIIQKNDTSYLTIMLVQAIGIIINFIQIIASNYEQIFPKLVMYIFCIAIPIAVIALEKKGYMFPEIFASTKVKILMLLNNNKEAKNVLINFVTKYPDNYTGHKLLAKIYEKEGGMRKAIDEYVKAIDINKKDYDSYYKIAELLKDLDKKEESAQMLQSLLRIKPEYYNASILLGDILCEQENFKEAINIYMEALRYNPNDYDIYYNLGIAYTRLNDFANAKTCYEKASQLNHLEHIASYYLGQIALLYRDMDLAEQYFTECIYSEELEAISYYELAKIYMLKGDKDKAITFINKAIELDVEMQERANDEPIFIPVKVYIEVPREQSEDKAVKTLSKKEKETIKHLEDMQDVVDNLGIKDMTKNKKHIEKQEKENQEERDIN